VSLQKSMFLTANNVDWLNQNINSSFVTTLAQKILVLL
jgi:hypothetical protein